MNQIMTLRPRLVWRALYLFVIPNILVILLNLITDPRPAIFVVGAINSSLAMGISVAFAPAIIRIFTEDRPLEKADWLAFGIWISWTSLAMRFVYSLIWRWQGTPSWMINTDLSVYISCMTTIGAISHLVAPGAIGDRIPPRRWIIIGLLAAAGVLCMIAIGYLLRVSVVTELAHVAG
jgi:hypothetical protein